VVIVLETTGGAFEQAPGVLAVHENFEFHHR
jgi:hypothetical protein